MGEGAADVVEVPLRARDGTIRAYALIDAADAERVLAHRWCLGTDGYARRQVPFAGRRQTAWALHRFVMDIAPLDPRRVGHKDRDPLNCRRANLRVATTAQHAQNRSPAGDRDGSSRYRGVTWLKSRGKWRASACLRGHTYYLGEFVLEDDAGSAAAAFRAQHMPFSVEAAK